MRKWAMIFASEFHKRGGIPWREAISLGWIAARNGMAGICARIVTGCHDLHHPPAQTVP
jgi:hypothetical protein